MLRRGACSVLEKQWGRLALWQGTPQTKCATSRWKMGSYWSRESSSERVEEVAVHSKPRAKFTDDLHLSVTLSPKWVSSLGLKAGERGVWEMELEADVAHLSSRHELGRIEVELAAPRHRIEIVSGLLDAAVGRMGIDGICNVAAVHGKLLRDGAELAGFSVVLDVFREGYYSERQVGSVGRRIYGAVDRSEEEK